MLVDDEQIDSMWVFFIRLTVTFLHVLREKTVQRVPNCVASISVGIVRVYK